MDALTCLLPPVATWISESDIGGFVPAYAQSLADMGYALSTQNKYLRSLAHFARWMTHCRLAAAAIDDHEIRRFMDHHLPQCRCPRGAHPVRQDVQAALGHFLEFLRQENVVRDAGGPDPVEEELGRYDRYLRDAQGLADSGRAFLRRVVPSKALAYA